MRIKKGHKVMCILKRLYKDLRKSHLTRALAHAEHALLLCIRSSMTLGKCTNTYCGSYKEKARSGETGRALVYL